MKQRVVEGYFVDVVEGSIFPARLSIVDGTISRVDRTSATYDRYILPGLIDAHIHIESSLLCPSRFAEAAVVHGTTAVVSDPHEIANVHGMEGIMYMVHEAEAVPLRIFYTAPSCVPAIHGQDYGGRLGLKEVRDLLRMERFVALGEVMDFQDVLSQDVDIFAKIEAARLEGKPIDGHAPGLLGAKLDSYIFAGMSTDHECTTSDEALEKHRRGMTILVREGSASKNLSALMPFAKDHRCCLVSDDLDALDLKKGHLDLLLRKAVAQGMDPVHAVRAVTKWPAEQYGLPGGYAREGGPADLTLMKDLQDFRVLETWISGRLVAQKGVCLFEASPIGLEPSIIPKKISALELKSVRKGATTIAVYQQVLADQIVGGQGEAVLPIKERVVQAELEKDILLLAVVNRYIEAPPEMAFVKGFGLKKGAIASSVAHDAHNIIGVGVDHESLALALTNVISQGGGYTAFNGTESVALPLPIAGLMSDLPCKEVASMDERIRAFVREMGCPLPAPFMTLSFQDPAFRRAVMGNSS